MQPHVTILMASYNGAEFISDQLTSIAAQTHIHWRLVIGDDGSTDETKEVIASFCESNPKLEIHLVNGPRKGSNSNFCNLLQHVPKACDYIAFADQDDVWFPDKLGRAISHLEEIKGPALYGSRTTLVDDNSEVIGGSARPRHPLSFRNALVQNVFGGNTCVLNRAGFEVLARAQNGGYMFDWYLYQLMAGADAALIFDQEPSLFYRQHSLNQIGANQGWRARLRRARLMVSGEFCRWNSQNIHALWRDRALLTQQNQKLLYGFMLLQRVSGIAGLIQLRRLHLYRQGPLGQAGLILAGLFGKI